MKNINDHIASVVLKTNEPIKELFLLRGLPGSGKSTLAKSIGGTHIEADMYFMKDDEYQFDVSRLRDAHQWCQFECERLMGWELKVVVSNTFTQEWEMKPYFDLAEKHGYRVYSLIVENRHGGVNEHEVPEDKLEIMKNRFEISL
jgi:predicted kinase